MPIKKYLYPPAIISIHDISFWKPPPNPNHGHAPGLPTDKSTQIHHG